MKLTFIMFVLMVAACRQDPGSAIAVQEMDSLLSRFSMEWKADSLGRNGFRMNNYSRDSVGESCLINGLNFEGYSEEQILKWLGKPNYSGRHKEGNGLIMNYSLRQGTTDPDRELLIYFGKADNVIFIMEKGAIPKGNRTYP